MLPQIININLATYNIMKNRSNQRNYCKDPLPFSQEPTIHFPSFYYKTVDRVDEHRLAIRIGLRMHQMRRFEEDHILFLMQIFNRECPRIRVYLISPNLLYGQVKIDVFQKDLQDIEVIKLEQGLFQLLNASNLFFASFIKKTLNQQTMTSQMFKNGKFQEIFNNEVIIRVKQWENRIFTVKI